VSAFLLPRVAFGDPAAVRDCIARYGGLVWSLARRLSPSVTDAEDAVQEIFVDLWRSAPRYDHSVSSEVTFVAMIARRRLIDRRRRRQRRPDTEPLPEGAGMFAGPEHAQMELCGEAAIASKAIAELRPEQREVLILSTYHGLSHEEISEALGMPLGTVKAHARRGLLRVRELLLSGAEAGTALVEGRP
jgi:RNA polymerase sigma factor (sigma-70 family)